MLRTRKDEEEELRIKYTNTQVLSKSQGITHCSITHRDRVGMKNGPGLCDLDWSTSLSNEYKFVQH